MRCPTWQGWPCASRPKDGLEVEPGGRDDNQTQATGIHLTLASTSLVPSPPASLTATMQGDSVTLNPHALKIRLCLGPSPALTGCVTLDKLFNLSVPLSSLFLKWA